MLRKTESRSSKPTSWTCRTTKIERRMRLASWGASFTPRRLKRLRKENEISSTRRNKRKRSRIKLNRMRMNWKVERTIFTILRRTIWPGRPSSKESGFTWTKKDRTSKICSRGKSSVRDANTSRHLMKRCWTMRLTTVDFTLLKSQQIRRPGKTKSRNRHSIWSKIRARLFRRWILVGFQMTISTKCDSRSWTQARLYKHWIRVESMIISPTLA